MNNEEKIETERMLAGLGSFQLDPVFYAPDGQVRKDFFFMG